MASTARNSPAEGEPASSDSEALVSRSRALFSSPCAPSPVRVDACQLALEHGGARLGLAEGVDLLALQDPAGDLGLQHEAQHEDDGR